MTQVLTIEEVAAKLAEFDGNQAAVARHFGVVRSAVANFIVRHPELRQVCIDARESMKDDVETSLHRAAKEGEAWGVCFYLKTQGRDRGYVENAILHDILREMSELREQVKDAKAANDRRSTSGDGGTEGGSSIVGGETEAERPTDQP